MNHPETLPALGSGLGYRAPYRADLFLKPEAVDFLEVVADHFLDATREGEEELELLASRWPVVPHALDLSLGSAEGLDRGYLERLAQLIHRLDPPWWSEHLCLTRAGGVEIGHLAPLPFTWEAVEAVCRNLETIRRHISAPLILENITCPFYLPGAEMSETEFLAEVLERTGCGLLLDVTNLYVNSINHGYEAPAALAKLPLERVVQLHYAGGHVETGTMIDSHSHPVPPEIWQLLDEVLKRAPVRAVLLERDEQLPPFSELETELERARDLGRRHGRWG